jgi:hypothetical protein
VSLRRTLKRKNPGRFPSTRRCGECGEKIFKRDLVLHYKEKHPKVIMEVTGNDEDTRSDSEDVRRF